MKDPTRYSTAAVCAALEVSVNISALLSKADVKPLNWLMAQCHEELQF